MVKGIEKRLPQGGGNLFQTIKGWQTEAEGKGIELLKLSIGQPDGPAALTARKAVAQAVMSKSTAMHEYQDNGSVGCPGFAYDFVDFNLQESKARINPASLEYAALPIPGIKPTLIQIIMACGEDKNLVVATTTDPGYPTPAVACKQLRHFNIPVHLCSENDFLPEMEKEVMEHADLFMMNYPHNPSGQIMPEEKLREICEFCQEYGVRLFNDGAYTCLDHSGLHTPLAIVAQDYPRLSWLEAFSSSKLGNNTGWRVAAACGSEDFISDLAQIKGDVDSGTPAFVMVGIRSLIKDDPVYISDVQVEYKRRLDVLISEVNSAGLRLAVNPGAGFFAFFHAPKRAFGVEVQDGEHFNKLMVNETGVVGVHFGPYIRYSVATCGFDDDQLTHLRKAFEDADVYYDDNTVSVW